MKQTKSTLLGLITLILLLSGCSNDKKESSKPEDQTSQENIFGIYQGTLLLTPLGDLEEQPSISLSNQLVHIETYPQAQTLQLVVKNFEYQEQEYGNIAVPTFYTKQKDAYELQAQNTVQIESLGSFEANLLGSLAQEKLEFDLLFSTPQTNEQAQQPRYQVRFEGQKTDKVIANYIFDFEEWDSGGFLGGPALPYAVPSTEYPALSWASTDKEVHRLIDNQRMEDYTVKRTNQVSVSQNSSAVIQTLQAKGDNLLQIPTIYAGKLYLGQFIDKELPPQQGIRLGVPFEFKPTTLKGYYLYTPGEVYYECPDPSHPRIVYEVEGKVDQGLIAAYLYEVSSYAASEEVLTLDELASSERVVATASFTTEATTDEFQEFDVSLRWKEGKEFDADKKYRLGLFFTASQEGQYYSGAPGSTLIIDYVRLLVEQHEQ